MSKKNNVSISTEFWKNKSINYSFKHKKNLSKILNGSRSKSCNNSRNFSIESKKRKKDNENIESIDEWYYVKQKSNQSLSK